MKRNILFVLLASLVILASCADKHAYTLTGKFETGDFEGKTVYLQMRDYERMELVSLDSAIVKNNQFKFERLASDTLAVYFLACGQIQPAVIIAEPGKIEVTIDSTSVPHVKGTPLNDDYQKFTDDLYNSFKESQNLYGSLQEDFDKGKITSDQFTEKKKSFLEAFQNKTYDNIKAKIQNPVGEFMLMDNSYYLRPEQTLELISMASPKFKSIEDVQRMEKTAKAQEACSIGKPFVDIKGKSLDDKDVALSDYVGKGKIVLVDFWASWCGPCIRALPEVIKTYQKFKDKGFEIVGVSLDTDKERWMNATKKHQVIWPQFSNLKGWEDEAAQAYGINSIPATILIDKNGIIVDKNLDGAELAVKLEKLMK